MKRSIAIVLALLLCLPLTALAAEDPVDIMPISTDTLEGWYSSFEGTIIAVTADDQHVLMVDIGNDLRAEFTVSADTIRYGEVELTVGRKVQILIDASRPVLAIYPAQYQAVVVASAEGSSRLFVGHMDENLVSADGNIRLVLPEKPDYPIVTLDGETYTGSLANQTIIVEYTIAAMSHPAIPMPHRITVITAADDDTDVSAMPIVVNGKTIEALPAYRTDDFVLMLPLRAVAEALDYQVDWLGDALNTIHVGQFVTLQLYQDYYTYARMAPISLGVPSALVEGSTFVPDTFFTQVLRLAQCGVQDGQIVVSAE